MRVHSLHGMLLTRISRFIARNISWFDTIISLKLAEFLNSDLSFRCNIYHVRLSRGGKRGSWSILKRNVYVGFPSLLHNIFANKANVHPID
jgi:hypothetical protein